MNNEYAPPEISELVDYLKKAILIQKWFRDKGYEKSDISSLDAVDNMELKIYLGNKLE